MDVPPLRESTHLLRDPATLRRRFRDDGYLFLRGVMPRDALDRTLGAVLAEVEKAGWLLPGTDPRDRLADPAKACAEPMAAYRAVYDRVFRLEAFHALPHAPELAAVMRRILDDDDLLIHPRKITRMIFPVERGQPDFTTPAHQDYSAVQGSAETCSVWIPLHDCPIDQGSLMAAEGTHRDGMYGYRLSLGAGGVEIDDPLEDRWRGADFAAGDILVFSTLLVHRGARNLSNRLRISTDCRFQRTADTICEACIQLQGESFGWEDVYAGWADEALKFYWKPLGLKTVPYDPRYYRQREDLALREGEKGNPLAVASLQRLAKAHPDPAVRDRAADLLDRLSGAPV